MKNSILFSVVIGLMVFTVPGLAQDKKVVKAQKKVEKVTVAAESEKKESMKAGEKELSDKSVISRGTKSKSAQDQRQNRVREKEEVRQYLRDNPAANEEAASSRKRLLEARERVIELRRADLD